MITVNYETSFFSKSEIEKNHWEYLIFLSFRILILLSNPSITIIMMIGIPQSTVTAKVPYTIMETTMKWTIVSVTYAKMTLFSGKKRSESTSNWIKSRVGYTVKNCCTFQRFVTFFRKSIFFKGKLTSLMWMTCHGICHNHKWDSVLDILDFQRTKIP